MIAAFRYFRGSRPFWGGLFTLVAGFVIAFLPLGPLWYYVHAGVGAIMGELIGVGLLAVGVFTWLMPSHHRSLGPLAVGLGLVAFPLTNLGGLIVGTVAGILGGAMTFGWAPPPDQPDDDAPPSDPLASHSALAEVDEPVNIPAVVGAPAALELDPADN